MEPSKNLRKRRLLEAFIKASDKKQCPPLIKIQKLDDNVARTETFKTVNPLLPSRITGSALLSTNGSVVPIASVIPSTRYSVSPPTNNSVFTPTIRSVNPNGLVLIPINKLIPQSKACSAMPHNIGSIIQFKNDSIPTPSINSVLPFQSGSIPSPSINSVLPFQSGLIPSPSINSVLPFQNSSEVSSTNDSVHVQNIGTILLSKNNSELPQINGTVPPPVSCSVLTSINGSITKQSKDPVLSHSTNTVASTSTSLLVSKGTDSKLSKSQQLWIKQINSRINKLELRKKNNFLKIIEIADAVDVLYENELKYEKTNKFKMMKKFSAKQLTNTNSKEKVIQINNINIKIEKNNIKNDDNEPVQSTSYNDNIKTNNKNNKINNNNNEEPTPSTSYNIDKSNIFESQDSALIPIGPNGTLVDEKVLVLINWKQPSAATRKLLMTIFDRETLAFHTLTGKPSPAFVGCGRPLKDQLDPKKVADIIHIVMKNSNAPERDVRSAITTKCADENKMYKQREKRKSGELNKSSSSTKKSKV